MTASRVNSFVLQNAETATLNTIAFRLLLRMLPNRKPTTRRANKATIESWGMCYVKYEVRNYLTYFLFTLRVVKSNF